MTDHYTMGRRILIQTLKANATIQSLFEHDAAAGQYKVYGNHVPATTEFPYITVEHYSGGPDNDAQSDASEVLWKITAHTNTMSNAENMSNAIHNTLHRNDAPVTTGIVGFGVYHWIELMYPVEDRDERQGREYFRFGGIFKLCLAEIL